MTMGPGLGGEGAQGGPERGGVASGDAQRQRDEFVVARRDVVENETLHDADPGRVDGVVRVERLGIGRIDGGRVDADQPHAPGRRGP